MPLADRYRIMLMSHDHRQLLRAMFDAAVGAASPAVCLPPHLAKIAPPKGRTIVVGAGKAAASMAAAVEAHWNGPLEGLVVTRYEHGAPTKHIEVIEASHPVPDAAGREAAKRILQKVQGLTARRSRARADFGRRLGADGAAGRGRDARGKAGGQQGAVKERREYFRDELRAQASLGDQGRASRPRRGAGARRGADDFRRAE